jgi:hypothetical protein
LDGATIVLRTVTVTFVPQHESKAVGGSKVQLVPHSSVRAGPQRMVGGLVSTSVTTSVQKDEFEQQSVACQFRVIVALHGNEPFVIAFTSETVTVPQQASTALGGFGTHPPPGVPALPHCTN